MPVLKVKKNGVWLDVLGASNVGTSDNEQAGTSQPTSVHTVKNGNAVTVTVTYDNNSTSESVIMLDENGDPIEVTQDGVMCSMTWEGFDE